MASPPQAQVNCAPHDFTKTSQHLSPVTLLGPSFSAAKPTNRHRQVTVQAQVHHSEVSSELSETQPDKMNLVNSPNTSHSRTPVKSEENDRDTGETIVYQKGTRMMGQDRESESQTVT